jgi:hypothetical protein
MKSAFHLPSLAAAALVLLAVPALAQTQPMTRIAGVVAGISGNALDVTRADDTRAVVMLTDKTRFAQSVPIPVDQIKPGSYIGTGAMANGSGAPLKAIEVTLFPEALRGAGEGHHGWNEGPQSSMTNGTVSTVVGTSERTITVTYNGGQQTIAIPAGTPIVTIAAGDKSMLVPGAHVSVSAGKADDGTFSARFVSIGKDGSTPPG